jgi:ankyrin repeat protein
LLSAVAVGDDARVAELLAQGADTHGADLRGRTPLMLAVMQRRLDMVRLLLAHGAAPNVPDRAGETPLQWARRHDAADMVAALEAAGAR